ncbi:MAG: tRNA lysidine(34) synthetase TilS [Clostridia bacterium]|nr:tRNA lysidine(34) synthetase TilS [Clostridia bacterium]
MKQPLLAGFRDPHQLANMPANAPVAVALSGGADSVALLSLLRGKKALCAVHVHHGIRGAEADRDAAFCEALAKEFDIPFHLLRVDAPAMARQTGESLETAARTARYAAITAWMREQGIFLLATAHHADDQLETMLQHLLRGSGTRGLCGIPACRTLEEGLFVVRPLLSVPKAELLRYLKEQDLTFVTDSTNEEVCCQRNFLRLRVLPLLAELQPNAPLLAARCAEALAGDEAYLDGLAVEFLAKEGAKPRVEALLALPQPILVRVMRRLLPQVPTAQHLSAICNLLGSSKPHASLSLPPHTVLRKVNGKLSIEKKQKKQHGNETLLLCESETQIKEASALVILNSVGKTTNDALEARYKYATRLSLCKDAVKGEIRLCRRMAGDVILSGGMHKAVRRLACLKHLPPEARARMPLLFDDDGILAIPFGPVRDGANKKTDLEVFVYFN